MKFFTLDKILNLAEKGLKAFARTAKDLEKQGLGNEGTAAFVRLSRALDDLGTAFVLTVANMRPVRAAFAGLAIEVDALASVFDTASKRSTMSAAKTLHTYGEFKKGLGGIVNSIDSMLGTQGQAPAAGNVFIESGEADQRTASKAMDIAARDKGDADRAKRRLAEENAAIRGALQSHMAAIEKQRQIDMARREAFLAHSDQILSTFATSWTGGFAHLGMVFHDFAQEVHDKFKWMKVSTVEAIGSVFTAIAYTGPLVEQVFGRSSKAAAAFNAIQMGLVAAEATVEGVKASGDAYSSFAKGDLGAGFMSSLAAGTYFTAAALAGVAGARGLAAATPAVAGLGRRLARA